MSSLNKRKSIVPEGSLTLALNAAEGRLMLALGRPGAVGSTPEFLQDTLAQSVNAALLQPEPEIFFAQEWQAQAQGVELLAPALENALACLKLCPAHIGRVAAVNGPGSFTGLRLGIISASAIARGVNALQAPMPYLSLLAAHAAFTLPAVAGAVRIFWIITHARRDLVHLQSFETRAADQVLTNALPGGGSTPQPFKIHNGRSLIADLITEHSPLLVAGLEEAEGILRASGPALALGSGFTRNRAFFEGTLRANRHIAALTPYFDQPTPSFLLRHALNLPDEAYAAHDISPLYARVSDAEENLPQIVAGLGFEPEESQKRLHELLKRPFRAD